MLSTFIKLLFVIKIFVLSIFESPFYEGFTANKKFQRGLMSTFGCLLYLDAKRLCRMYELQRLSKLS